MSIKISTLLWNSGKLRHGELLVGLSLADWADEDGGNIFPRLETLAGKSRLGVRRTKQILALLQHQGALICEREENADGPGLYRFNLHFFAQPEIISEAAPGLEIISKSAEKISTNLENFSSHIDNRQNPSGNRQDTRAREAHLRDALGAASYAAYFGDAVFEAGNPPRILMAKEFKMNRAIERFGSKIRSAFGPDVVIEVQQRTPAPTPRATKNTKADGKPVEPWHHKCP